MEHNRNYEKGSVSFKLGVNQFTDMFAYEVISQRNGFNCTMVDIDEKNAIKYLSLKNIVVPTQIDWRTLGAVTAVKDQGNTCLSII